MGTKLDTKRKPVRRLVRITVFFLVFGAAMNVLIAWAFSLRELPRRTVRVAGIVINTIFYAAAIPVSVLVTRGLFIARRLIRKRKGLCIKCGYDLRGSSGGPCPECGASVIPAKRCDMMLHKPKISAPEFCANAAL